MNINIIELQICKKKKKDSVKKKATLKYKLFFCLKTMNRKIVIFVFFIFSYLENEEKSKIDSSF